MVESVVSTEEFVVAGGALVVCYRPADAAEVGKQIADLHPSLIVVPPVHEVDARELRQGWGEVERAHRLSDRDDCSFDPQFAGPRRVSTQKVEIDLHGCSSSEGVAHEGGTCHKEFDRSSLSRRLIVEEGHCELEDTRTAKDAEPWHTPPP